MLDFKEREESVLKFWEDNDVFQKSVDQRKGGKPFVFYEGPPTANGSPGIHHFVSRAFKDLFCRFQAMRGRYVLRKGGWDTHGLPVEIAVEKELGFKSKKDIETYGVAAFNRKCRESVWKYREEWERFTKRIGYWVDLKHPYVTYENPYIESLWNIIATIWDKDLLYQAHRVVPFCTRCGTPLSSHEVAQGYKTVTDNSVYLKFRVTKSKLKFPKNTSILAWTTTPWTLPGNVALAVGKDIRYVLAHHVGSEEYFVLAEDLASAVLGAPLAIDREFSGSELVGTSYAPLFAVRSLKKPASYKVYEADFVSTSDGTGVVHTAVMYGEDDYQLGTKLKLVKHHTVDEHGKFFGVSEAFNGKYVKSSTTEAMIIDYLTERGNLLKSVPYEHEYPFCWRCDTPLLYYAKDSWFIRVSAVNKQLLANNQTVNWVPAHLKEGRFGQWIREGKDWAFSRERYWGTPLPIWRTKDGKKSLVIRSLDELDTYRADKPARLWTMRHGESVMNVARVIDSGQKASPLTPSGQQQVTAAAVQLKDQLKKNRRKITAIIASPIQRTKETAEIMARELGIKKIIFDERLREIQLGPSLTGCHDGKYHELYPRYEDKFTQRPPSGESLVDLKARMWSALKDFNTQYSNKDVLVVSHEYSLWMLHDVAAGWSTEQSIAEKNRRGDDFVGLAQIEQLTMRNLPRDEGGNLDMHRPYVDDIILKTKGSTAPMRRIPELCDVWFDSGSMPYAQWHWPFENDKLAQQNFPADFIAEGVDQTRGWFYTLLAVSTLLGKGAPYRTVLSNGHVLDEKGFKMSKSKGNVVKPDDVMDTVGVDAARWYFYTINSPGDSKNFSMKDVRERLTGFIMTLQNCVRFYELYRVEHQSSEQPHATNLLDTWILSRLSEVTAGTTERLERYELTEASRELEKFVVEDFSQWWLRRSRKRDDALPLLRHILKSLALLLAPFVPFTAEELWQKMRTEGDSLSVHLADWPKFDASAVKIELYEHMARVRSSISAGLAIRKNEQIRVRQPLASITIPGVPLEPDLEQLILDELNVKAVKYEMGADVALDMHIGTELRAEGFAREVMRAIQDMRKEAGCQVADRVACQWSSPDADVVMALRTHDAMIRKDTGLSSFIEKPDDSTLTIEKNFDLAPGKPLWIGIRV